MIDWPSMSFQERVLFIENEASRIYVRAEIDGGWKSVALTELPDKVRQQETNRLAKRDVQPVRLKP